MFGKDFSITSESLVNTNHINFWRRLLIDNTPDSFKNKKRNIMKSNKVEELHFDKQI